MVFLFYMAELFRLLLMGKSPKKFLRRTYPADP